MNAIRRESQGISAPISTHGQLGKQSQVAPTKANPHLHHEIEPLSRWLKVIQKVLQWGDLVSRRGLYRRASHYSGMMDGLNEILI